MNDVLMISAVEKLGEIYGSLIIPIERFVATKETNYRVVLVYGKRISFQFCDLPKYFFHYR